MKRAASWQVPATTFGLALLLAALGGGGARAAVRAPAAATGPEPKCVSDLKNLRANLRLMKVKFNLNNPEKSEGDVEVRLDADYTGGAEKANGTPEQTTNDVRLSAYLTFSFDVHDKGGKKKTVVKSLSMGPQGPGQGLDTFIFTGIDEGEPEEVFGEACGTISNLLQTLINDLEAGGSNVHLKPHPHKRVNAHVRGDSKCKRTTEPEPCATDKLCNNLSAIPDKDGEADVTETEEDGQAKCD